ncbi:MAG TPA: ABC transporter ATP-binding protein [Ktedonobacterales bacterium]|nr:ABC transporter ATP-binding protein [Ktedonobacterales bacterium]
MSKVIGASGGRPSRPLLEVRRLSVEYQTGAEPVRAVTEVDFTLHRGEILGLAGESGSGKSTLAYAVARLLRPPAVVTAGEVHYWPRRDRLSDDDGRALGANGRPPDAPTNLSLRGLRESPRPPRSPSSGPLDVLRLRPADLRAFRWNELAIVFQSAMNALNPVTSLGRQIDDTLRAHRPQMTRTERRNRALELLRLVGIAADRIGSYPHELSGGMRQRAIIAIALALNPEIIIMDEPTTALDVVVQREILEQIQRLQAELDFAVIFITHDLSLLLEIADSVAVMYAGRIVEQASREQLYTAARHPYSFGLINSFPPLHGPRKRVAGIPGSPPDLRALPPGCAFAPRCPFAFAPCTRELPLLCPTTADDPRPPLVACHLYDPRYAAEPPTTQALAERYAALAGGRSAAI